MACNTKSKGFGSAKPQPSPFDVSFGVTKQTFHLARPHAVVKAHTPEGERWLAQNLDDIKERCEQVWDSGTKNFIFDAFTAFSLKACQSGLAVRVGIPGGLAFIANSERKTQPDHAPNFGGQN